MTPKEKALKLCQQFGVTTLFAEDCNDGRTLPLRVAKQCALIAVNEILITISSIDNSGYEQQFYENVKQEIDSL